MYIYNSPHKVAGGPLVQIQLNRAAVIETLVSTSSQESEKKNLSLLYNVTLYVVDSSNIKQ